MYFIRRNADFKALHTILRFYSIARKSHYDTLKLRRNCTDKEIKEAFIQMSKEYHPDKNKDARAQDKFVRIVEAYNILSKPGSRAQYDNTTEVSASYVYRPHASYNIRNTQYGTFYGSHTRSQTASENPNTYYGVSGVKKLPNYYIIALCIGVAFIGVLLQLYVIRNMYMLQRKQAQEKSKRLAEELDKVRFAATHNGNELQTRLILDKIVTAANPTVATASLGQALACEKKDTSETLLTEFGFSEETHEWSYYESMQSDMKDFNTKLSFQTWH